jgi:hypothetical protein
MIDDHRQLLWASCNDGDVAAPEPVWSLAPHVSLWVVNERATNAPAWALVGALPAWSNDENAPSDAVVLAMHPTMDASQGARWWRLPVLIATLPVQAHETPRQALARWANTRRTHLQQRRAQPIDGHATPETRAWVHRRQELFIAQLEAWATDDALW